MIGIVTDSSSQLTAELATRFGIAVVPLTVTIDGVDYREGVDIEADRFYALWTEDRTPDVTTSQPPPGAFVEAYRRAVAGGATEILSVHLAESMSGTLNSARIAARELDVPVRFVDTGTASFGVACCAWVAADARDAGADLEGVARTAEECAGALRTSFVVGIPQLADRSGRARGVDVAAAASTGVPVLAMSGGELVVLDTVVDVDAAVDVMVRDTLAWPPSSAAGLRVAIGTSDASSEPVSTALTARLVAQPEVADVVQYRIGPSVGAHTGPGTAGLFVF